MHDINSSTTLRAAILQLECTQDYERGELKEQVQQATRSLNPVNAIKQIASELAASQELKHDLVHASVSMVADSLAHTLFENIKNEPLKKMLTNTLLFGFCTLETKITAYFNLQKTNNNHANE